MKCEHGNDIEIMAIRKFDSNMVMYEGNGHYNVIFGCSQCNQVTVTTKLMLKGGSTRTLTIDDTKLHP